MTGPSSHMWFVQASGGVWGPYPEARVAGFVTEGRVGPSSLISPWARGPFAPARESAEFAPLFETPRRPEPTRRQDERATPRVHPVAGDPPVPSPDIAREAEAVHTPAAPAGAGPARPLLVWLQYGEGRAAEFQAALNAFGPNLVVRSGLWLVQARTSPATLRNLLSRRLGEQDALLVVQATLDQAAWFNLDPNRDRELRRLWNASAPR